MTSDKGVIKKIIRHGQLDGGASGSDDLIPTPSQTVTISFECHLENGTLIDSSIEHQNNSKIPGIKLVVGTG